MKAPWLRVGERIEFEGSPWEVVDVNVCAATIQELHPVPRSVSIPEKVVVKNGTVVVKPGREFEVCRGRKTRISPTSIVPRLEVR